MTLRQESISAHELRPGEVMVRVEACGLNFADVFAVLGLYGATPKGTFVPGLEVAGIVEAVGSPVPGRLGTQDLAQGDRVIGVPRFGGYSTHVKLDAAYVRKGPSDWSPEQAAAFPVQALTAVWGLCRLGDLRQGGAVLVQSAAGGVGLQALEVLARKGALALGLVGNEAKAAWLRSHFAGRGVDFDFAVRPAEGTGAGGRFETRLRAFLAQRGLEGFDVVLDSVAGDSFWPSYRSLAPMGRYVVFGAAALTPRPGADVGLGPGLLSPWNMPRLWSLVRGYLARPRLDVISLPGDNKGVVGFNLIWLHERAALMDELWRETAVLQLPAPHVGRVFSFSEAPQALEYLQSGQNIGKVVLRIDGDSQPQ